MAELIADFEAEHVFAHSLWDDDDIKAFLEENGYKQNMLGNLIGLYSDEATVAQIQALPDGHPLKEALFSDDSLFGINRHKGNASGGNQFGKNSFLQQQIRQIMASDASAHAKGLALDNLFDWTTRLAKGQVLDANGNPIPVMGNTEFAETRTDAFLDGTGEAGTPAAWVDPADFDRVDFGSPNYDPDMPEAERLATIAARDRAETRRAWLDATDQDGNLDLFITNQFDQLFQAVFGGDASEQYERNLALAKEGILGGWMKIENVDVVGSYFGRDQTGLAGKGDFNMVFRAANPIWATNDNRCARDAREAA